MEKFVVIIPAFREENRIARTIAAVRSRTDAEIVVVDDGSPDGTEAAALKAGATVLKLPFNLGYGGALQAGYKYAIRNGYEFVVQMDADGQHDPSYIKVLLDEVTAGKADVAIGSRFLGGDYSMPAAKRIGVFIFSRIVRIVTGKKVTDPTSGFQALNRRALRLYAGNAYPVDFPDADVLIMLHKKGVKFTEIPVQMKPNPKEKTMHSGIISIYYVFKMFLSILVTLMRREPE